jgi:flagellar protein FlaJ
MKIHPEVYLSIVLFFSTVTSTIVAGSFLLFWFSTQNVDILFALAPFSLINYLIWSTPIGAITLVAIPAMILLVGFAIPSMKASNRISGLKNEIPYASVHMSVMASGGLNPYSSLLRLKNTDLLPKLREEIERIQGLILSSGSDPVSAMERAAKVIGLKEYKDLLLGYASTLRTGGDVIHYLYSQTNAMFRNMATRIKAMGENMAALMEAYSIIEILGGLGIYIMFVIGFSLPEAGMQISPELFFFFSFVLLPMLSVLFLFLSDSMQINYPISYWRTYIVYFCTLPVTVFLALQTSIIYLFPGMIPEVVPALKSLPAFLAQYFGFGVGCEPSLGLAFSLIVTVIPALIFDRYYSREEKGILNGITSFLRDLVENRKTGLSPEKCIQILSDRDYREFSKYLKRISSEINWGLPLREVFEDFRKTVKSWLAQINIYLLIDSIEVGGGTEESLESLAEFSESIKDIENERRATLAPLFLVPYIGAGLLTMTTILLLQFFNDMLALSSQALPLLTLNRTMLTPLILNSYMLGLVTGKITTGRTSAGFKHAIILVLVSVAGIWMGFHFKFMSIS